MCNHGGEKQLPEIGVWPRRIKLTTPLVRAAWYTFRSGAVLNEVAPKGRAHPQDCPTARFSYDSLQSFGQLC